MNSFTDKSERSYLPHASTVQSCIICKSQKRKCDKQLPQCSRCRRHGRSCYYAGIGLHARKPQGEYLTTLAADCRPHMTAVDETISNEVLSILADGAVTTSHVIHMMRSSTSAWLPIIDLGQFEARAHRLLELPNAQVATLLLLMHMLNQLSARHDLADRRPDSEIGVEKCRKFFLILQLDGSARVETVQAGIYLSALNLSHGRLDEASLALATSVALMNRLRLHHIQVRRNDDGSQTPDIGLRIWHGVTLLDNLLCAANVDSHRLVTDQTSRISSKMEVEEPTDATLPENVRGDSHDFVSQMHAAIVLGEVCTFVKSRPQFNCNNCQQSSYLALEGRLRTLSTKAIQGSVERVDTPCLASPLTFIAMIILYQHQIEFCGRSAAVSKTTPEAAPLLALDSTIAMVRDVVNARERMPSPAIFIEATLYYIVGRSIMALPNVYTHYQTFLEEIIQILSIRGQRARVAKVYANDLQHTLDAMNLSNH